MALSSEGISEMLCQAHELWLSVYCDLDLGDTSMPLCQGHDLCFHCHIDLKYDLSPYSRGQ